MTAIPVETLPLDTYLRVRSQSEALCEPLETEDYVIQTADFASPAKWHLSHVSWFFETFLLEPFADGYRAFDPLFTHLFNSYYQGVGSPFPRPERGALSRPTVKQVYAYRAHVDQAMAELLADPPSAHAAEIQSRLVLGLSHEQQHQELLLMDLKYNLSRNPILPAYRDGEPWRRDLITYLRENRDVLAEFVRGEMPSLTIHEHAATYLYWIDCSALDVSNPCQFFAKEGGIFLTDGGPFGDGRHVRFNFGCPRDHMLKGLEAMKKAMI
mgnify:CR=1 FL=1